MDPSLAGAEQSHVMALEITLSRTTGCGGSLPVTFAAYTDYSCAAFASLVASLGGTAAEAANCSGDLRRVQQAAATVAVPLGGSAALLDASNFHDFTSLVSPLSLKQAAWLTTAMKPLFASA